MMLPESWQYFTEILKKQCLPKIHSEQVFVLHHFSLQNSRLLTSDFFDHFRGNHRYHRHRRFHDHHCRHKNCCQKCSEHCDLGNTFCRPKKRLQDGGILMNAFLQMRLL
jgi:hypothetical protein